MAKILGVKNLLQKKFVYLQPLPSDIKASFGDLVENFIMIVWGMSGNGKSNFLMQFLKVLIAFGKVLYVSLEEGHEASIVATVKRHLGEECEGQIHFADHEMTYDKLMVVLAKKKSAKFVIIDSVQYWNITYDQYKALKERFKKKTFLFISHATGKLPDGRTADKIRYDAPIKVRVEGYVAFVVSRYGGNKPYVIWEQGAKKYWGKKYQSIISGVRDDAKEKMKAPKRQNEDSEKITKAKIAEEEKSLFKETLTSNAI